MPNPDYHQLAYAVKLGIIVSRQHSSSCAQPSLLHHNPTTCDPCGRPKSGIILPFLSFLYVLKFPSFPLVPCLLLAEKSEEKERIAFSAPEALRLSVHLTGQSRPSTASKYVFQDYLSPSQCKKILYNLEGEKKPTGWPESLPVPVRCHLLWYKTCI